MKNPVDFDWYCKTKKDVINNAAYELIVALTAKSAPPRKFELSVPQRDDEMIANVVESAINAVEAQIGYYCHPFYGAVSSSGFGDGGYTCYTHADENGVIDFAFIVFI